jgi:hypothetical protein
MVEPANRASATGIVYRDVSEAYWKVGNKPRAVAVFNEGREAGGDVWLYSSSAAAIADGGNPVRPPGAPEPTPGAAPEATPVSSPAVPPASPPKAPPVIVPATPPGALPPGLPAGTAPGRT